MKFLELVEGRDDVLRVSEFLGGFAEVGFDFKVLFEIIGSHLVVEVELVVELFDVELIVLPKFGGVFSRHDFDFFPFVSEVAELFKAFVGCFG